MTAGTRVSKPPCPSWCDIGHDESSAMPPHYHRFSAMRLSTKTLFILIEHWTDGSGKTEQPVLKVGALHGREKLTLTTVEEARALAEIVAWTGYVEDSRHLDRVVDKYAQILGHDQPRPKGLTAP